MAICYIISFSCYWKEQTKHTFARTVQSVSNSEGIVYLKHWENRWCPTTKLVVYSPKNLHEFCFQQTHVMPALEEGGLV